MFSNRRARRERERQQDLSERIRSAEAGVRVAAAAEIVKVRDQQWALRELAQVVDREPSPATFAYTAGYFCDALCRDRAVRVRVEQMFARHDDDPAALARPGPR
ncbi:hypothetical protein ABZT08_25475 [Streptomyces sp. NPDC005526]|uniref:hypothetical protein n=1 Tax=Streptomyces sp. NPDC005526 TaxID=3156885 RepID=UPI0033A32506